MQAGQGAEAEEEVVCVLPVVRELISCTELKELLGREMQETQAGYVVR